MLTSRTRTDTYGKLPGILTRNGVKPIFRAGQPSSRPRRGLYFNLGDGVDLAVRQPQAAVRPNHHVADDAASRRKNRPGLEFLRRRIESDEHIRVGVGFHVPDDRT